MPPSQDPIPAPQKKTSQSPQSKLQGWMDSARDQVQAADDMTKKKAVIGGVWGVLSLIALGIAFLPYMTSAVRDMDASLKIRKVDSLSMPITAFHLENTGSSPWTDKITLTLNGTYVLYGKSVEPRSNAVVQLDNFKDSENDSPAPSMPLRTMQVHTSAGDITFDLEECSADPSRDCAVKER